jgi:uncharacterized protein with GYD domain
VAIYIQLITLTAEGRVQTLDDPESILDAQRAVSAPGIRVLGQYAVLGQYDYVGFVEAPDNEAIARYSLELGVRAGLHITTLPAIPMGRLDPAFGREPEEAVTEAAPPVG